MNMLPPIICLMGPTATGKTEIAIELTKHLPCDIISVDSAMIYRGMDIGTAKPSADVLANTPHRLINICDPSESYSAAQFCNDAHLEIKEIHQKNRIPLLVGGTMLYFRALQRGLSPLPSANSAIREQLTAELNQLGSAALHARLQKIDPAAAQRIHPNDPQRLQRALEIYALTSQTPSELYAADIATPFPYQAINIALAPSNRHILHERIANRFHQMIAQGFIEEVTTLKNRGDLNINMPSMRAVGYRQVWEYLENQLTYDEMIERGIIATRQLAKRQLTWLRAWPEIQWFDSLDQQVFDQILFFLDSNLKQR